MKRTVYTSFETLILETYIEGEKIVTTVRKYEFEKYFFKSFQRVTELIKYQDFDSIPNIIGSLLTTINDKLAELEGGDKEILEELSSTLFIQQIELLNLTEEGRVSWSKCIPVLKETCEFKGYDFSELSKKLNIDYVKITPRMLNRNSEKLPYYIWLGKDIEFDELVRDIKSYCGIKNMRHFKALFKPIIDSNFIIEVDINKKEKLLVLFSELKNKKLIGTKNTKGHFYPLVLYTVDFGKKVFEKEPKRYLESLKRRKVEYDHISAQIRELIEYNIKA